MAIGYRPVAHSLLIWTALAVVAAWIKPLTLAAVDDPYAKWESDIKAFEAADKTNPPPGNAILFVGSSSIRMWKSLADDFQGLAVINRGFGGSQMADTLHFADRIVLPYRPKQILVYAGDNDLAAGKSPEQVLADFTAFVELVHRSLPKTPVAYIAIKPSPSRWKLADQMRATNRRIAALARSDKQVDFIDVFTPMLGEDGQPRPDLFLADNLHLNSKGYQLWRSIIRPRLKP
jgi:lysophospholipase L1-like esterase